MLMRREQAPRPAHQFGSLLSSETSVAMLVRIDSAHDGDRDQVQGLLDGTPVVFREQYGVAPLASFCGGDRGHGAAMHARTSKRNASGSGQAVRAPT